MLIASLALLLLLTAASGLTAYSLWRIATLMAAGVFQGPEGPLARIAALLESGALRGPAGPAGADGASHPPPRAVRIARLHHDGWKPAEWVREATHAYDKALRTPGEAIIEPDGNMILGDQQ